MKIQICLLLLGAFIMVQPQEIGAENVDDETESNRSWFNVVWNIIGLLTRKSIYPDRTLYLGSGPPKPHFVFSAPRDKILYNKRQGPNQQFTVKKFMPDNFCGVDVVKPDMLLVSPECAPSGPGLVNLYAYPANTTDLFGHPNFYQNGYGPRIVCTATKIERLTDVPVGKEAFKNLVVIQLEKPLPASPPLVKFPRLNVLQ